MKPGIIVALLVSTTLVGGALWSRLANQKDSNELVAISKQAAENNYEELLSAYLDSQNTSSEPLTGTDLIGRQLILDYVALARDGQASQENLSALAERYVDSLPTLISHQPIYYTDLKLVPNNATNYQIYADALKKIYEDYSSEIYRNYSEKALSTDGEGVEMYQEMSQIYKTQADKLLALSVPGSLGQPQLDLINLYLENSSALSSISDINKDPASSFAGLIKMSKNLEKESQILSEIESLLNKNGII